MNKILKLLIIFSTLFMISCEEDTIAENIEIQITKPTINRIDQTLPDGTTVESPSVNLRFSATNNNAGKIISIEEIRGVAVNLENNSSISFVLGASVETFLLPLADGATDEIPYTYFAVLAPEESTGNSPHFDQARIKEAGDCDSDGECIFEFNELYIENLPATDNTDSLIIPRYRIDVTFIGTVGDHDESITTLQSKQNALVNPKRKFNKTLNIYTEILD